MTLNNFNTVPEGEIEYFSDIWANRADFNVKTLKRYASDVIGLQEFEPIHWATYQQDLPEYEALISNANGEGTAILWQRERFELLAHDLLSLPASELSHLTDLEDDNLMNTTCAKLRCRETGCEFIYLSTHLNDVSEGARQEGNRRNLQALSSLDASQTLPVIIGGDFNCNPWSPVYRTLLSQGFIDTYRAAGHADSVEASTFHGFHGANYFALEWGGSVFWRVDWMMARSAQLPIQTLSCTIVRDAEPPIFVSDHYPVVTELLIGD
jgi:endonuclease/exonuclease/phosphatase family metal-dependent hydrolase